MTILFERLAVSYEYPVHFVEDVFAPQSPVLAKVVSRNGTRPPRRVVAVVDGGVTAAWPRLRAEIERYFRVQPERPTLAAEPLVVPGGDGAKGDPRAPRRLLGMFSDLGVCRQSVVLAVGGCGLLDLVGFAASMLRHGVRVVRIPTTAVAQIASGATLGNGIHSYGKIDFLGTYAPPFGVVNDERFLLSLPLCDRTAGAAEALRVALARDARLFETLCRAAPALALGDRRMLLKVVRWSAGLCLSSPVDLGAWSVPALRAAAGPRLRRGDAVAIGVALDTAASVEAGLLGRAPAERVLSLLERFGFSLWDDALGYEPAPGRRAVLADMRRTMPLVAGIGRTAPVVDVGEAVLLRAIDVLHRRRAAHAT